MNDNNWHGNSRIEMAEMFRDWVENAPQLPIQQIVHRAKQIPVYLKNYFDKLSSNSQSDCEEGMSNVVK